MRRACSPFLIPILALAALPGAGSGQDAFSVRVFPRAGLLRPDNYLYERFAAFAEDDPTEWTTGDLGRASYLAMGVEVGWAERGILFRGEVGRTVDGWLLATHGIVQPRVLFEPPQIVNTYLDVPAAVTFASVQVVLPTRFNPWGLKPYVLLGGGGKWYHFGDPTRPNQVGAILPSDGFTPALDLGGGLTLQVRGLTLDVQARDTLNRYWGKSQNDLVFSGGILWRVR